MVRICGLCFKAIILQIWPNLLSVWPDDQIVFSIFGHLQQWKFAPTHSNCVKVSYFFPNPNEPYIYLQRFLNICQSGGTSPNSGHTGWQLRRKFDNIINPNICYFRYNFKLKSFSNRNLSQLSTKRFNASQGQFWYCLNFMTIIFYIVCSIIISQTCKCTVQCDLGRIVSQN